MPTPLYHITHVDNLASIAGCGAIWCDNVRRHSGFGHQNIAHEHIKERRARRIVPTAGGGTLGDYVPFYFAPRSPMLFTINRGNVVPELRNSQNRIVHLVTTVESLIATGRPWCFTDRHADLAYARFFSDAAALDSDVSWQAMADDYWGRSQQQRELRQAEFLLYNHVLWSHVQQIGVMDAECSVAALGAIREATHQPPVEVHPGWYY